MSNMLAETKVFNGKKFVLHKVCTSKSNALEVKKILQHKYMGYNVRISERKYKGEKRYLVWRG